VALPWFRGSTVGGFFDHTMLGTEPMAFSRACLCILGLFVLGACGAGRSGPADREGALLSSTPPPRGNCSLLPKPATLPRAAELIDTSALTAGILAYRAERQDVLPGYVLLSMGFDHEGLSLHRRVIEHSVGAALADSVQKLVFASLLPYAEGADTTQVRLRVDIGQEGEVGFLVGRSEYCPPWPRDARLEGAMFLGGGGAGLRYRGGRRERLVYVRVLVSPAGVVSGGGVVRGGPVEMSLERDIVFFVRQFAFHPATIDGQPVYGAIDVPLRVPG
jgi:hypothetical protein